MSTWTRDATLVLDDGYNMITSGAIDSDHAYFGCMTNPGKIAKVRLSDFTQVDGLSLCDGQCSFTTTLSLDTDGMLYAGTSRGTDGLIVKIASDTMLEIDNPIILPARRAGAAAIFTNANPHFLVVGLYNKAQGLPPNGTKVNRQHTWRISRSSERDDQEDNDMTDFLLPPPAVSNCRLEPLSIGFYLPS